MGKYDDILALPRHVSARHEAMARPDRAKQFVPFAALKGYDETIADTQTVYEPFLELGEEQRDRLDARLQRLREALERKERPRITVIYFVSRPGDAAAEPPLGHYCRRRGTAEKMDPEAGRLRLDGEWLPLASITALLQD